MEGYRKIVRRPLIGIAFCYALGVWLGVAYDEWFTSYSFESLLFSLIFAFLFLLIRRRHPGLTAVWFLGTALVLAGAARSGFYRQTIIPWQERFPGEVMLKGLVHNDPEKVVSTRDGNAIWEFSILVQEVWSEKGEPERFRGRTCVKWFSGRSRGRIPEYGECWMLTGRWVEAPTQAIVRPVFQSSAGKSSFLSSGLGWTFVENCYRIRRAAARRVALGIEDHPEVVAVIRGLVLGYRRQMPPDIRNTFVRTGTLHVFAVSGLHVGIVCLFLAVVLKFLGVSRIQWIFFLAPLLIGYTLATGARASAIRACIMAMVYYLAPRLGRRSDGPSALALAGLLILMFQPDQLLDAGYIYSFVVVGGLFLFYPVFERMVRPLWIPDPFRVQDETKWMRWLRKAGRYFAGLTALSISAWLVSAPLTAYFFGHFSPVALFSNLLVIPLVFLIVLAGWLSILLGSCFLVLGLVFNYANWVLVTLLIRGISLVARIPLGYVEVPRLPVWGLILCYPGLIGLRVILTRRFPAVQKPVDPGQSTSTRQSCFSDREGSNLPIAGEGA